MSERSDTEKYGPRSKPKSAQSEGFTVGPKTLAVLLSAAIALAGGGGSFVGAGGTSRQLEGLSKKLDKAAEERVEATKDRADLEKRLTLLEQTRYTRDDAARDRAAITVALTEIKVVLAGMAQRMTGIEVALKERK